MQDGATSHTVAGTKRWLENQSITIWSDWPRNSPDLNVIENLWPVLQNSVFEDPRPRTQAKLVERVKTAWDKITEHRVADLVESFGQRVSECLDKKRHHIISKTSVSLVARFAG
jgi:hypothetical protein